MCYIEITDKDGEMLVRLARDAVEYYVLESKIIKPPADLDTKFLQPMGVFVTLNTASPSGHELRGCIGQPLPERPFIDALIDSAISSAVHDPRFSRVLPEELENLIVEVSVLTPPERIRVSSPREYCNHIQVGEDGLIMKWRLGSGLLLPQVPVEYNWGPEDFLCHTCIKAGAAPDHWLTSDAEIYKFKAIVFTETSPRDRVVRRRLK